MSFLLRRPATAETDRTSEKPARRPTRAERRAQRAEAAAAAELAARIARAQRRLAQATGPLPVIPPRRSSENAVPTKD